MIANPSPAFSPQTVTLSEIQIALSRIRSSIPISPCARSETFSELTGNSVYLKLENLQRTGAYKERGALNKLLSLDKQQRARGVIAASAGNHAQAVSYHAARLGIRASICMPLTTPLIKVSATRGYGAEVILHGAITTKPSRKPRAAAGANSWFLSMPLMTTSSSPGRALSASSSSNNILISTLC